MMDVVTPRIASIPWAAALIDDPDWTLVSKDSRERKPSDEDSYTAETLMTDRTIRTYLLFRPNQEAEGDVPFPELRAIVDVGAGLNGHPGTAHGGFSAALLDELCGNTICMHKDIKMERMRRHGQAFQDFHYYTACSSP